MPAKFLPKYRTAVIVRQVSAVIYDVKQYFRCKFRTRRVHIQMFKGHSHNIATFLSPQFYPSFLATRPYIEFVVFFIAILRIFQRNGLKLGKDLIFSGLVQNMYVYRMAESKKI